MRNAIVALLAAVALVIGLFALLRTTPKTGEQTRKTSTRNTPAAGLIVLAMQGGQCRIESKTEKITAAPDQLIFWWVDNHCDDQQTVKLQFDRDTPVNGRLEMMVMPRQTSPIVAVVKKDAKNGTYPYAIFLNGNRQTDPEIVIEYSN